MSLTSDQITAKNFKKYHEAILPYLNGSAHSGFTPIGTVISVMGTTAPLNYLACDGTVYNISDYPELAAYFNAQFGTSNHFGGNGTTTFAVPDLRGEFLRGTGTNSHANQGSGAAVGVHQDGTEHLRIYAYKNNTIGTFAFNSNGHSQESNVDSYVSKGESQDKSTNLNFNETTSFGTYTSRPTNTSVLYCIASKNIFMDAGSNYSTEEQVVGTWIDGRPIYQKVIKCGKLSSSGTTLTINHNIENVKFIRIVGAWASQSGSDFISGGTEMIPNTNTSNDFIGRVTSNLTAITIRQMNDWQAYYALVIVQYTKTTDA